MHCQIDFDKLDKQLNLTKSYQVRGKVHQIVGTVVEGYLPGARLGTICDIITKDNTDRVMSEVVGFRGNKVLLAPYSTLSGISNNCAIEEKGEGHKILVGAGLLGRIIDGLGNPMDGKELPCGLTQYNLYNEPPNPICKKNVREPMDMGIRAINSLYTIGKGQRLALMAGSGVGKSVLMGMIARNVKADINVIALIGERGREVNEFIEKDLGKVGLARSVVVVVSSDRSPLVRIRGANLATSIAEYFRDLGKNVLLMMDSVTRFAHAHREVGLSVGEPPTTKGYTPSVFSAIPRLLERVGTGENEGSITGIYTVLVDGDDFNDPVADAVRGTLDGHIVLSRDLAMKGIFPAINVEASLSRVMVDLVNKDHWKKAQRIKELYSAYERSRTLIEIGAYQAGADPLVDEAILKREMILNLVRQDMSEGCDFSKSLAALGKVVT